MKVLLIRFSSIGDLVMTTPVVRCLRNQFPNAEIHFATKKQYASILEHNPHINQLHLLDDDWQEFVEAFMEYDWVFDLHKNLRSKRLIRAIKAEKVFTYNKRNVEKWLLTNLKVNRLWGYSVVENYFESLPIKYDGKGLDFHLNRNEDFAEVATMLPKAFVAIALGGNFETKQMPAELVNKIIEKLKLPVVLLGGTNEKTIAKEITQNCYEVIDLVGKLSLQESAFVVSVAAKIISNDTGLMHIAAAFNKPMAVLWGNTVREFGFAPVYAKGFENRVKHFEVADLKCRPCSKLGHEKCPKGHFKCMVNQDVVAIAQWAVG